MQDKNKFLILPLFYLLVLFAAFKCCVSDRPRRGASNRVGSSVIFPVAGNVYPDGYYHVTLNIGNPPKPYSLDIDTGSDLTWLQCDAPCVKCTPAPHTLYKPNKDLIMCLDPICASLNGPSDHHCQSPKDQCDYEVEYADHGSSMGVLLKDSFLLRFTNGSTSNPRLAFGCGYNQEVPASIRPPYTDGILGLGIGKSSIVGQLSELGLSRNILGHCLSSQGGGFLFFGDDVIPSSGIVWTSMSSNSMEKHYSLGPAELHFGGKTTGVNGLTVVFDSGSTYSYFSSQAYKAILSMLMKDLSGKQIKDATEDHSLPVCWKGSKPFKSIHDVKSFFKPIALSFSKNAQFRLPPEAYLIITGHGNACFGILNGTEVGLGNFNIIGDISLQNNMVIYDNEKRRIGWAPATCDKLPNMDDDVDDESLCKPHPADFGILKEYCDAIFGSNTRKEVKK